MMASVVEGCCGAAVSTSPLWLLQKNSLDSSLERAERTLHILATYESVLYPLTKRLDFTEAWIGFSFLRKNLPKHYNKKIVFFFKFFLMFIFETERDRA